MQIALATLTLVLLMLAASPATAEPYLAVRSGLPCSSCHVNPIGGGLRTPFGSRYAASQLAARGGGREPLVPEAFDGRLLLGGNARWSARSVDHDDRDDADSFDVDRVSLYLVARFDEHISFYLDEQVAPGGSITREAWGRFDFRDWYLKVGRIYLPLGWRLEDDEALVRLATGVNFDNPDNGVELGFENARWSLQLAVSNGTAGAPEQDDGKQVSLRAEYLGGALRLGVNGNVNHTDAVDRDLYGLFAGLRTGPLTWLLEWDHVEDSVPGQPDRVLDVALIETNWEVLRGHNLKVTLEWLGDDGEGEEDRYRGSAVWEYFPWPHTQVRAGWRQYDSDNGRAVDNREEGFVQLHLYF